MSKKKFKGFDAFKVCCVYLITEYKDNCMYKTKFIGNILCDSIELSAGISNIPHTFLSPLSTEISIQDEFEIDILTRNEIINIISEL